MTLALDQGARSCNPCDPESCGDRRSSIDEKAWLDLGSKLVSHGDQCSQWLPVGLDNGRFTCQWSNGVNKPLLSQCSLSAFSVLVLFKALIKHAIVLCLNDHF